MNKSFVSLALALAVVGTASGQTRPNWFSMPNEDSLLTTARKVYFHYQSAMPLQVDNLPFDLDYYTVNYMNPYGENGKFLYCGGWLRNRPLAQPDAGLFRENWLFENARREVRMAINGGADAFDYDLWDTTGQSWSQLKYLLDAAVAESPKFKILFKPDMTGAFFKADPWKVYDAIKDIHTHQGLARLSDGRMIVSPFNANVQPVQFWQDLRLKLAAEGIRIVLLPSLQGFWNYDANYYNQALGNIGVMNWGGTTIARTNNLAIANPTFRVGQTVTPQYSRPNILGYRETWQSHIFRRDWTAAINSNLQFVNVASWNDLPEGSEIQPCVETNNSFFELNAYYTTWFKLKREPVIYRDTIFLFNRIQRTALQASSPFQTSPWRKLNSETPDDQAEALVFLKTPATIKFSVGEGSEAPQVQTFSLPAGMSSVKMPLIPGHISVSLVRNNLTQMTVNSKRPVVGQIDFQDYLLRGVVKSL